MTSGVFETVPIDIIWVDRAERQRRDIDDLDSLKFSIKEEGLIHPPVIRRDGKLIVGERRWNACKQLGWTAIPVQYMDRLDPIHLHIVEMDENLRRKNISWQEECLAVKKYHELRRQLDPNWAQVDTAIALGTEPSYVGQKLDVADEILKGNTRVAEAPLFSTARGIVQRNAQRSKDSVLANISFDAPLTEAQSVEAAEQKRPIPPILHRDFTDWVKDYTGPKFNFLHCDFPYGVGMHESDQGAGKSYGTYMDTADVYWDLLYELDKHKDRIIADSAHIMFWFSMDYYTETKRLLELMGFEVNPFPLVWFKSDSTGILPDPKRGPRRVYETAFFGSVGDRFIVNSKNNVCAHPGKDKSLHMNEKPVEMLKHFFAMFVDKHSVVLDPTCGSANALKAAQAHGANFVLGLERDDEFHRIATENYYAD